MRHKITALLVPLILLLSGVGAATGGIAADGDVQTSPASGSIAKTFVIGQEFYITINESEYVNYACKHVWTIGGMVMSEDADAVPGSISGVSGGVRYTLVKDSPVGLYRVSTVRVTELDKDNKVVPLADAALTWTVQIKIDGAEEYRTLDSKTIVLRPADSTSVSIVGFDVTDMPVVGEVYNHEIIAEITASNGEKIKINGADADSKKAVWYALGLPAGLSMSSDGHINGVAKEFAWYKPVNFAISYGGIVYIGTFEIIVYNNPASSTDFKMFIDDSEISDNGFFMGIQSKVPTHVLAIKDMDGKLIDSDKLVVRVVDSRGDVAELEYAKDMVIGDGKDAKTVSGYLLPDDGTGAYLVTVSLLNKDNLSNLSSTQSFTFYSLPAGTVSADILISGS